MPGPGQPQAQSQPGQPAPGGQDPQGGPPQQGGPSPAAQAVHMIQQGYAMLGKIIQSAGGQVPPQTVKLFQTAAQATDAMLQDLTSPQGQGSPQQQKAGPSQPMPMNANAGSQQSGPQGR